MSLLERILGRPLATHEEGEQRVGPLAGLPMLGLDALASAAYGPEAALTLLIPLGALGLRFIGPISLIIIALLLIVYFSYRQTITAYPGGGGSYTVARQNLGTAPGLLAAAALLLDYVLVVAIGISAGVGALVSVVPALHPYTVPLCLTLLGLIALINLRGVRESGWAFVVPTYLFVGTLFTVIGIGVVKIFLSGGQPVAVAAPPPLSSTTATVSFWLLLHAFASGCTALTGVEAISNGITAFRAPAPVNARRTLTAVTAILVLLLLGIALLSQGYQIGATEPGQLGYESVLSQLVGAVVGKGLFYYLTMISVLTVLAFSANTGFADFPRLCRIIAQDDFLPHAFASRGRRLVFSHGILVLTAWAGLLLIAFGGITDRLIPLFAVGAFLAFTLSQAGMVAHWWREGGADARRSMMINGIGATATAVTLGVVLIAKFSEGAWITLLLLPALLLCFTVVKRHYNHVALETTCPHPLDLSSLQKPIVIVPIRRWDTLSHKGLRFGLKLSDDVRAVQILVGEQTDDLRAQWDGLVVQPAQQAGFPAPQLVVLPSPYRHLLGPLYAYIMQLHEEEPTRQIAVIVAELVERRWYHYFLHNQRAQLLKTLLLFRGDQRIIVITVPWYLTA